MRVRGFRLALAALVLLGGCADIPQPESTGRRVTPVFGNPWSYHCLPTATPEAQSCRVQLQVGRSEPRRQILLYTVIGDGRWWVSSPVPLTNFAAQLEGSPRIYHGQCPAGGSCFLNEADGAALTSALMGRARIVVSFNGPFGLSGGRYDTADFFPARSSAEWRHAQGLTADAALAPHVAALAPTGPAPRGGKAAEDAPGGMT